MKNVSLNKKGFTLVELLAVIVILALLIVITANTVLPMMNKSKKSGMVTYAERAVSNATASYQADSITGGNTGDRYYSIYNLMGARDYFGCVQVVVDNSGAVPAYTYNVKMFDSKNKYYLEGTVAPGSSTFSETDLNTLVADYTDDVPTPTDYDVCSDEDTFDDISAP